MAKLTNTQIEALVNEARQRVEDANKTKIEKFSKTNKKLAEYLKLSKQYDELTKKRNELDELIRNTRNSLNTSADFKKQNLSINYNGALQLDTYKMANTMRHKITLLTIGKDFDLDEVINNLIAEFVK
jgi:predicted nuclease with TOPRIM domain